MPNRPLNDDGREKPLGIHLVSKFYVLPLQLPPFLSYFPVDWRLWDKLRSVTNTQGFSSLCTSEEYVSEIFEYATLLIIVITFNNECLKHSIFI